MKKLIILGGLFGLVSMLAFAVGVYSEDYLDAPVIVENPEIIDRYFMYKGLNHTMFITTINGTIVQEANNKQVVIYNWGSLSGHAKDVIRNSMEMQGYNYSKAYPRYEYLD